MDIGRRKSESELPRLRILAVDDDLPYLKYIQLVLTRAGFDVELAADGKQAIERIGKQPHVDLLLIDLGMPDLDGIETVRLIHQVAPIPPLYTILLTAKDGTEVKLRAFDSGLDDFITKRSPESEIIAKIRSAARRLELERRLHIENEALQSLALTDELTGIANRRALFRAGEDILQSGRQLSVVLFDLDRFKQINDAHGHLVGDHILADVAATFKTHTRYGDLIGRYGGDEFLLLLPDTGVEEARPIATRLLNKIRQLKWSLNGRLLTINAQSGVAGATAGSTTLPELLATCDQALYKGKKGSKRQSSGLRKKVNA